MKTIDLLKRLTETVGVSGAEDLTLTKVLTEILSEYGEVSTDSMNNVFCTFGEGYHFMLDAHIDEIGFIVKEITDDGFVKVDKCGGIDNRMLLASEVSIWGKQEIKGVISTLPPHLQKTGDEKNPVDISEIAIDIGMSKMEAEKLISLGDRVTFKRNFTPLLNNQLSSSCLDDRSGVAAIILAAEKLKNIPAKITLMCSSQEEVGTRGAKIGPFSKKVDEAIVVDVSFAYSPLCKKEECGEISKGPMIGISPVISKSLSDSLIKTAKRNDIPYQLEIMGGGHTGTNADVISVSETGIKTALVSIPEKYMHSPIEVVDVVDVENTANLIAAYITERVGELNA